MCITYINMKYVIFKLFIIKHSKEMSFYCFAENEMATLLTELESESH